MIEQRDALLRLLRDDDPETLDLVKQQLAQQNAAALGELRTLLADADPLAARHLRDAIAAIETRAADAIFGQVCAEFGNTATSKKRPEPAPFTPDFSRGAPRRLGAKRPAF